MSVTLELVRACRAMPVSETALAQARRCVFDGLAVALAAANDPATFATRERFNRLLAGIAA